MMSLGWLLGLDGCRHHSPFASSSLYPPRRMTISMFQVLYFPMLLGPHFYPSFSFTISPCRVSWPYEATLGFTNPMPVHKVHPECQLASLSQHSISELTESWGTWYSSWQHNSDTTHTGIVSLPQRLESTEKLPPPHSVPT